MSHDPVPIGSVIGDVLRNRGWARRLDGARVRARWPAVVGDTVAEHCTPVELHDDGTLEVLTDSAAWATQLSYLRGTLMDRLNQVCGTGLVTSVQIRTKDGRSKRGWR